MVCCGRRNFWNRGNSQPCCSHRTLDSKQIRLDFIIIFLTSNGVRGTLPTKGQTYLKDVVTLKLDIDKCIGCGMCAIVCPHGVFEMKEKKTAIVDRDACMECGACACNCPASAISVRSGVGCAYGIIMGKLKGTAPTCDCRDESDKSCCSS